MKLRGKGDISPSGPKYPKSGDKLSKKRSEYLFIVLTKNLFRHLQNFFHRKPFENGPHTKSTGCKGAKSIFYEF